MQIRYLIFILLFALKSYAQGGIFGKNPIINDENFEKQKIHFGYYLWFSNYNYHYNYKTVGKDNYLIFLTADHAGAENVNFLKDNKYEVNSVEPKEIKKGLSKFSIDTFGENLVLNYSNFNLYFNKEIIKNKGLDLSKVKQSFKEYLMTQTHVKRVYTEEEILASTGNDFFF